MTALGITAVGIASGQSAAGISAVTEIARWSGQPAPAKSGDAAADTRSLMALRRRTGQRYLDPLVERGVRAIEAVGPEGESAASESDPERAFRTGILLTTRLGPSSTREQLYKSMSERQGRGVSATLFSSCGFNIASAVMAKVLGIRGPSLTFAATPGWGARMFHLAGGLFARGTVDRLYLSYADGNAAIVLRAEPWELVERRATPRALRLMEGLGPGRGKAGLALGAESDVTRAAGADGSGRNWRAMPLQLENRSPGLALDPTFLSIAWLWEVELAKQPRILDVAVGDGLVVAFEGSESARSIMQEGAIA